MIVIGWLESGLRLKMVPGGPELEPLDEEAPKSSEREAAQCCHAGGRYICPGLDLLVLKKSHGYMHMRCWA